VSPYITQDIIDYININIGNYTPEFYYGQLAPIYSSIDNPAWAEVFHESDVFFVADRADGLWVTSLTKEQSDLAAAMGTYWSSIVHYASLSPRSSLDPLKFLPAWRSFDGPLGGGGRLWTFGHALDGTRRRQRPPTVDQVQLDQPTATPTSTANAALAGVFFSLLTWHCAVGHHH
jgi:hypothetical protein